MARHEIDMIHGPLAGKMITFALPLAATAVLQQLFNAADIAVVGRFASSEAMAAVGSNASVIALIVNLFMGLAVGANVVVANLIGARKKEEITAAVHTVMAVALITGVLLVGIGNLVARPLLTLMGAPKEVMEPAVLYLRIYFLAMPGSMVYNFGSAVLRSKGDSKRPLLALMLSGVINILLNLLLVIVFRLHVIGVGAATVASNVVSAAFVLWFLTHEEAPFRLDLRKLCIRKSYLVNMIRIGMPAGLQGMVFSFSNIVIQSAINSFGAAAIAGSTAAQNLEFVSYCVINAFAQTAVTFTSQNYAAGDAKRCKKVFLIAMGMGELMDIVLILLMELFRVPILSIFTTDPAVLSFAVIRVATVCFPHFLIGSYEIPAGALRGMNHSLVPALISIFGTCVFRLIWVLAFVPKQHDFQLLMLVYPASWIFTGLIMNTAFLLIRRKAFRILKKL